ncbi:MAG: RecQ family ATP-dependent DNA helicase, partial [Lachnospiraceae bacterium]|nr:RecQ family ATP-dependent DNA helicase [Lachnospiraceae bacterium]
MDAVGVLKRYWGYDQFRPLQLDIIESVLQGRDTLGLLPTGGGKSITFQVPAMMLDGITIVVTPLISLMKDQVDNLMQRGIRAYCLHSGLSRQEARLALDRCRLGKAKLLYLSPEKLQSPSFLASIQGWNVSLIVVDEAHCISQWGYDFRPSYLRISELRDTFPGANTLALTASATPRVADDITARLGFRPGWKKFAKSFSRANLSYIVRYDDNKDRTLMRVLGNTSGSAIVYVRSRKRCGELAGMLAAQGISALFYHAGLDSDEKNERQNLWKEGKARVMVATNAFGMGIDKADVRVVAHYDLPASLEEYYQEAGRAGRDGKPAFAVVIANGQDKGRLTRHLSESFPPKEYVSRVYEAAGDFLEVAVGDGYNRIYEFNFSGFCSAFKLQPAMARSSLVLLTRAQYIEFSDETQSRARVMVIADKHEFYGLRLDEATDRVLTALLRTYTGLFADYTPIEETALALKAEVSQAQAHESLLLLSRMHVISYIPKRVSPYLYYATSREEPRDVQLPRAVYEDRREDMARRIESMKRFVFDSSRCRVESMLEYFGEEPGGPCGTCDVCRAQGL